MKFKTITARPEAVLKFLEECGIKCVPRKRKHYHGRAVKLKDSDGDVHFIKL